MSYEHRAIWLRKDCTTSERTYPDAKRAREAARNASRRNPDVKTFHVEYHNGRASRQWTLFDGKLLAFIDYKLKRQYKEQANAQASHQTQ